MIVANFDFSNFWSFSGEPSSAFGISFSDGEKENIKLKDVSFGYTLLVDGAETETASWPSPNAKIIEVKNTKIFENHMLALPDQEIYVKVWVSNKDSIYEDETSWIYPKPKSPYSSWEWVDGEWVAPVPYPEDGNPYGWDEESLSWIRF